MGINEISQLQLGEKEYRELLLQAVAVIDNSKSLMAQSVCSIATNSYWGIGKLLFERKLESRYGEGIVRRLSGDLKEHFPQMGLSTRQLWNMKAFYIRYKDCDEKVLRSVAVLPWSQNLIILSKNLTDEQTIFYATESIHKGWNRDLLLNAIKMQMHVGGTVTIADNNFATTLPATQAQYANEVFRGRQLNCVKSVDYSGNL